MKKLLLLGILLLTSFTITLAETLTVETSNITQTSATITVTGTSIQKNSSLTGLLSVVFDNGVLDIPLFTPPGSGCTANICSFPATPKTISNLTCNTSYRGNVKVLNSINNISKPIEFRTLSCSAGIRVTFDSITSSGENKALIKIRVQDTVRPSPGLNVKAEFTPIPVNPFSPTPEEQIIFSKQFGTITTASSTAERSAEKEIDISCTEGTVPKRYSVVIEATRSGTTPPVIGRSQPIQFTTELCPEPSAVTTGGGTPPVVGNNTYTFLTPLPLGENLASTSAITIGASGDGGILGILQRIFTLMLVTAIVLAVVFMIIGGARYATGDTLSGKMGGREIITNAITGLLFALLSWLLLNVVNPDLLRFTLYLPNIGKDLVRGTGSNPIGSITGGGCPVGTTDEECHRLIMEDEEDKRAALETAHININANPCASPDPNVHGCTNVGLLNDATLANIIKVKTECNCAITITGGTEYWLHSSGGNHKRFIALDLSIGGNALDTFIRSKQSRGSSSGCNERYEYSGLLFCDEQIAGNPPHWHVDTISTSGGGTTGGELIKFENIGKNDLGVWGKASRQQISESEIGALASSARVRTWYAEVQRVAGINSKILAAIIMVESSGDPTKVRIEPDGRKSCGLGQLLTDTAKRLDTTLTNKSVEEICTALKEPNYNIRLSNQYYNSLPGNFKTKVATYNGGGCVQVAGESDCRGGATGTSVNCSGLARFECPWDSSGCYEPSRPNDRPTNTSCAVNTGYEVTRFYVDKVKKISDQLR